MKPIFSISYPVPKVHKEMLKKEVENLVIIRVLEKANNTEWRSQSFAQTKPKSNGLDFLSDLRNLSLKLKREPYTMSKINEMLLKLGGFKYDTPLDLNMRYYHVWLSKNAINVFTITLPRGKYHYKRLPMVIANYPDIFQQKTNDLFHGFEFTRAYIDNLLI